jgi:hypothetical protein
MYTKIMNGTTTKLKVYIVFREARENSYSGNNFVGVFFDRKSAEGFIAEKQNNYDYFIETYEQPEAGMAHEVYD